MSIEGGENSQSSTFPGSTQRAPPPSFSASSFAGNQRKRPILSGLGSEPTTHSDFTSPNTPTPYESKGEISSLHARTTPSEPMSSFAAGTPIYKHASHPSPSTKEPHLSSIHSLLNEFQLHFDMKKQRISALESELSSVDGRLQQREIELQSYATERISSLEQLKNQKLLLDELQRKLAEFSKYESMISSRFANFEVLMKDLSATKANYLEKESELKKTLQEKNSHLEDSLRLIGELRVQKGQLESKSAELEDDLKQQCTEFNQKIHQLNTEIQEKSSRLDALYQEREILKADVKNMSFERDRFQRESAQALKEISALAVSDAFASLCPEDSLRSLSSAVNWIKGVCNDLQENQKHSENHFDLLKAEWTSELELSKGEVKCLQREVDSSQAKCTALQIEIDRLSQSIPTDDYLKIIEELGFSGPDWRSQLESFIEAQRDLEAKVEELKQEHAKEITAVKDQCLKTFLDEKAALRANLQKAESELARLKSSTQLKPPAKENPDLTSILGLKELGKSLGRNENVNAINERKRTKVVSTSSTNHHKGSSRALRSTTKINSPHKSQDSVLSNDIWTIFK